MRRLALALTGIALSVVPVGAADTVSRLLDYHAATSDCGAEIEPEDVVEIRLDASHSIYSLPCEDFAYNFIRALYRIEGDTVIEFPLPSSDYMGGSGRLNQVYSLDWNADTAILDSYYKGGNGNCGAEGKWHWTGDAFELIEIRARDTCDQTDDEWPVVAPK